MSSRFITFPIPVDARDLIQNFFDYMKSKNSNWTPDEGQPDVWIGEATASEAADIGTMASQVPKAIFRIAGQQLFGIPSLDLINATVHIDIYAIDNVGHTIDAGYQFSIIDNQGNFIGFKTLADAVIAPGDTHIDGVLCVATVGGSSANNIGTIGDPVTPLDVVLYVDHVNQADLPTGGQDAETDDAYLDRLALEIQTMSPRPILSPDFSILARNIAGVQRSLTLDGYNPADDSFGNERMVTVYSMDSTGLGVDAPTKTAIETYLDSLRELNFVVNTDDPEDNSIAVTTHFTVLAGYDLTDVQSRVYSAIQTFLNPAIWGILPNDDPNNPKTWLNVNKIYYLELASVINNVAGVDIITSLTLGADGGALASADYAMTGRVPLPSPGTITVVGSYV